METPVLGTARASSSRSALDKHERVPPASRSSGLRGVIVGVDERPFGGPWTLRAQSSRDERIELRFDAAPTFACELPEGRWSVDARARGCASPEFSIDVGDGTTMPAQVRITLVAAHAVHGRLMSAAREPLAEFPLSAHSAVDGRLRHAVTDPLGYFEIEGLAEGRHALAFGDPEHPAWHWRTIEVRGTSLDVGVVEAPELADVTVVVVDDEGVVLEGVSIAGRGARGGRIEGSTNERGELRAERVPLGRYLVTASARSRGRVEGWVELESGAENRCTLRLRR